MLVFFALGNAKVLSFALGDAKVPNAIFFASQWNIGFKPIDSPPEGKHIRVLASHWLDPQNHIFILEIPTYCNPESLMATTQTVTDPTQKVADPTQTGGIEFALGMQGLGLGWLCRFHVVFLCSKVHIPPGKTLGKRRQTT